MIVPFNIPYVTGLEIDFIKQALESKKLCGDGKFTKDSQAFFEKRYGFPKTLLTTSCTDAIEMSAILADIQPGDEVIMPSYTFVSTANPFLLRGAKIVFADSEKATPNIDVTKIESLVTSKTKAIVPVHYAGIACDMDVIMDIAEKNNLLVIEDAAHSIDSKYKGRFLGGIGHMAAFSFHETKNIISGEGGMIVINDQKFADRAEIIREKGTNRAQFFRGEVDKYGWVDIGSSFLTSEIIAAYLCAQLQSIDAIQEKRMDLWERYFQNLSELAEKMPNLLPVIPSYATNNAHMFYLKCDNLNERTQLISHLSSNEIKAVFHYLSLHKSKMYADFHGKRELAESDCWTDCLVRLPLFVDMTIEQVDFVTEKILDFYSA